MIALSPLLSPLLSWAIVLFLVAFFVWFYAVIKTQRRAEYMSRRWIEEQWRAEHRRWVAQGKPTNSPFAPHVLGRPAMRKVWDDERGWIEEFYTEFD